MYPVSFQAMDTLCKLETKLAKINYWDFGKLFRVWREVPWLNQMFSQLNHFDVLHTGHNVVMATIVHHAAPSSQAAHFVTHIVRTVITIDLFTSYRKY